MPHGLILRFMSNGDVVQRFVEPRNAKTNTKSMLHLYDNAEINHESETKRVITG